MNLLFPVERWFAWHPVRTCDHGWQWRKTIFRRNVVEIEKKKMHWQYFYDDPSPKLPVDYRTPEGMMLFPNREANLKMLH